MIYLFVFLIFFSIYCIINIAKKEYENKLDCIKSSLVQSVMSTIGFISGYWVMKLIVG